MLRKIIYLTVLEMVLFGCGVKDPNLTPLKPGSELKKPKFDTKSINRFMSSLKDVGTVFNGSMILWHNEADIKGLSQVISLSGQAKNGEVVFRESLKELEAKKLIQESVSNKIKLLNKVVAEKRSRNLEFFLEELKSKNDILFKRHGEFFENNLKEDSRRDFEIFCDAKLIDFISSDLTLKTNFKQRPTPFSLCERVYAKKKYFIGNLCENSSEGKNYLKCLWSSSFVKGSQLQVYKKNKETGIKEEVKRNSENWIVFEQKLAQTDWFQYFSKNSKRILLAGLLKLADENYYLYFNHNKKKIKDNLKPDFKLFFKKSLEAQELFKNRLLENQTFYNHSDLIFNFPFIVGESRKHYTHLREGFHELAQASKEFSYLYGKPYKELNESELEELKPLAKLKLELDQIQTIVNKQRATTIGNEESYLKIKGEISTKLAKGNLAYALWPNMEMKMVEGQEGKLKVSWTLDQENSTNVFEAYASEKKETGNPEEKAEFLCFLKREEGGLQIDLTGKSFRKMGWQEYEKSEFSPRFSLLNLEKTKGVKMTLKLDYRFYSAIIPMFTGKVFIYGSEGEELYQGSVLLTSS